MKKEEGIIMIILLIGSLLFLTGCLQESICGDKFCETGETQEYCPYDCKTKIISAYVDKCGNGNCDAEENESNCPKDCKKIIQNICGDNKCDQNENSLNCPQDCTITTQDYCGDGEINTAEEECEPKNNEFNLNCISKGRINCNNDCKCQGQLNLTIAMPQNIQDLIKDTDNGGLADWIENLIKTDINNMNDDEKDTDNDKFTDLQEYIIGTDINNSSSHP